ncbi:S1C family serine protease [Pseudomonas siliginis]|uniref:S1C family serine protease n=1 Tax=Pseudomonas siliginis TaxID=2842346 RepID=UPI0020932D70|nr:S1C family serine protease [Pseudomonas siliginis]UST72267.1 S1C family serine protease [Pseudomonas siliginis]
MTIKGSGTSKGPRVSLNRKGDNTPYALIDAPVVQGMPGGPVYGADGTVIGIIVGIFSPQAPLLPALKNSKSLSVYVPYDIIQREWRLFSKHQAEALMKQIDSKNQIVRF